MLSPKNSLVIQHSTFFIAADLVAHISHMRICLVNPAVCGVLGRVNRKNNHGQMVDRTNSV